MIQLLRNLVLDLGSQWRQNWVIRTWKFVSKTLMLWINSRYLFRRKNTQSWTHCVHDEGQSLCLPLTTPFKHSYIFFSRDSFSSFCLLLLATNPWLFHNVCSRYNHYPYIYLSCCLFIFYSWKSRASLHVPGDYFDYLGGRCLQMQTHVLHNNCFFEQKLKAFTKHNISFLCSYCCQHCKNEDCRKIIVRICLLAQSAKLHENLDQF